MSEEKREDTMWQPFPGVREAIFVTRVNRFLIECDLGGKRIEAFLPNPGRLQELLLPGKILYVIKENGSEDRRTAFTVVGVFRDGYPIMLHTHKTNQVVTRLLEERLVPGLEGTSITKAEVRVGHSRFDFLLHDGEGDLYLEVKSCTLVGGNVAMFPDAVTARGARHLEELARLSAEGTRTAVIFVIHWPHASIFMPDYHTDLHFARTLIAVRRWVQIIPLSVQWLPDLSLSRAVRPLPIPWDYVEQEARDRGSYILILSLSEDTSITVGSLGRLFFRKGFYLYVGSAMNGLSKRIERHRRLHKQAHWHIDYLRPHTTVHSALAIRSSDRLECSIARAVDGMAEWSVKGFGCSDCHCESHLFAMSRNPIQAPEFQNLLQYFRMDRIRV